MTTTRRAIITNRSTADDLARVQRFLPSNYSASLTRTECILIEGTDSHGWTLDAYVLPRLASGLISAVECINCDGHGNIYDPSDTEVMYCTGWCYAKPGERPVGEWRTVTAKYSRVIMAQTLVERLDRSPSYYRNVVRKGTSVTFDAAVHEGASWWEVRMDLREYVGACGSPSSPGSLDGVRCPASY